MAVPGMVGAVMEWVNSPAVQDLTPDSQGKNLDKVADSSRLSDLR